MLSIVPLAAPAMADAGAAFRDCPDCPEMMPLEPEPFVMGFDGGRDSEKPAHLVTLDHPFAIGVTEVTYGEWQACMDDGACPEPAYDRGWDQPDRPVIYVTLAAIERYLAWLSARTGRTYRLPSEAEWEFAAHGGATGRDRARVTGKTIANCNKCIDHWNHQTMPVKSFPPNGYGLYDMLGNVMEWTSSCWTDDHRSDRAEDCSRRVRRGGSWYFNHQVSTPTYRFGAPQDALAYDIGFRVAVDLENP